VEAKLIRAKERREKASKQLEASLVNKNEQAFLRAQQTMARKREKYRTKNNTVKQINERHSINMTVRRKHALHSLDHRLNSALSRAEESIKSRQKRASRRLSKLQKAQNKRALLEFERRSALLASVGHRAERAARNHQLRIEDLQGKARGEIQHVQDVAKRVRAVRVLQKMVRSRLGLETELGDSAECMLSMTAAAQRFQNCVAWRTKVVDGRLVNFLEPLKNLVATMGFHPESLTDGPTSTASPSFEQLTAAITNPASIALAKNILSSFEPLLRTRATSAPNLTTTKCRRESMCMSARTLLSVFLVAAQPEEVLGEKHGKDKCSNLLEGAAAKLVKSLLELAAMKSSSSSSSESITYSYLYARRRCVIQTISSNILSYCTFFDKWKNADLDELVDKMTKNAHQSWVAYLTSKQALIYMEEKYPNQSNGLFQHVLKHKSAKKGAASHIKRVRAAMKKILGEEQSFIVMKGAKEAAMAQIEKEQLIITIKSKIDKTVESKSETETSDDASRDRAISLAGSVASDSKSKTNANANIPDSILSNAQLVHQLLLMDNEDLDQLLHRGTENFKHLESAEEFMVHYKNSTPPGWIEGLTTVEGIRQLMVDLIVKMKSLVPNRADLQEYFTEDQIRACDGSSDYFTLALRMADALSKSLESQYRSVATMEWYDTTEVWHTKGFDENCIPYNFTSWKSFLVASLTFLMGKVDLCQLEVANFQLLQVAPIVRANGKEYETHHFQKKFGEFSKVKSTNRKNFRTTWNWIERMTRSSAEDIRVQLQDGFVDEILFAKEAIDIPEVLSLDMIQIHHIRERARLSAISSSMILHACKITNTRISELTRESMSSEAKYHKDKMDMLLNTRLSYEALLEGISESMSMFAQVISGKPLDQGKAETIQNVTNSVLKGTDPVFSLMDKRMKSVFKLACRFTFDHTNSQPPISMKTGRQGNLQSTEKKVNGFKAQFMTVIGQEATKLGFNIVEKDLVQATYDAHKVITHCVGLYQEDLFNPMFAQVSLE